MQKQNIAIRKSLHTYSSASGQWSTHAQKRRSPNARKGKSLSPAKRYF